MNFGKRLQRAIDELEISQAELGRRVGATAQSVNGWCSSGILPRKEILEQLPKATGKPVYWFFMTDEDEDILKTGYSSIPHLTDEQRTMLVLFEKLLPDDQVNMINLYRARIEELETWAKKHFSDKNPQ